MTTLQAVVRSLVFPGVDLHTRNRASLSRFWRSGPREVLDAGCGNGYFAWLAYRSGASVLGITHDARQVAKARALLLEHRGADPARLRFEQRNLYDLGGLATAAFDEIICYEVLEHLRDDVSVVCEFYRVLRPGGVLHVCCPNKDHPRHRDEVLDTSESGGHVRRGYDADSYRALLEPAGFLIERMVGVGPRSLYLADRALGWLEQKLGFAGAALFLPLALPLVRLAPADPATPFSLYARAVKRAAAT
jgi:SAM-dependent methyltransferase